MCEKPYDHENSFGTTYGEHREFLEFGVDEYKELQEYAKDLDIHMFATGHEEIDYMLNFRDYLRAHPKVAQAYSDLKAELAAKHRENIDEYLMGKHPFIQEILVAVDKSKS